MFSHLDKNDQPQMVDITAKKTSKRKAHAQSVVLLPQSICDLFCDGDLQTAKGSVIQIAIIAGIMAAKKTSELIPLCHPIALENCNVEVQLVGKKLLIDCYACTSGKTGVEMEALTGASVAALTVYDMCKGLSHDIVIETTKLMSKQGGKRDFMREK
ncbi:cyclic pyranopterin monophosphate synthase MoaC [Candidatus Uabimicrobium amorphum]|uniref:Cyclic pyranopterin monophosphate synthaseaccessory protein n=1 Tax=Uabimicrobium amorphum TaxID=2596890 RepID=A0A5S9IJ16_UABAM|nr:cyclic pyranopterin monophosphate synthase MoaC [Candidatus Uabimicrobium amorphum]BBM82789.1 cyclic pyranopterin monophosphate synthaseaccessory protein [Candidatus Uabimicrobium amorphum]